MPKRICSVDGCCAPHRARGLCSTHYNQQHQPSRHVKATVRCAWCGAVCLKDRGRERRYSALFCTPGCRDAWSVATGATRANLAAARAARSEPRARARRKLAKAARGSRGPTRISGQCCTCGDWYVTTQRAQPSRFCSRSCKSKSKASRRRARRVGVGRHHYSRYRIFERDCWRCHICKRKVSRTKIAPHPLAPVIDHLVPLADGGPDAPHNVACAHFRCNSVRREVGQAQLLLFG